MTIASPAVPIDEHPIASFETEHAENTFPALPVRTGESVVVWFSPETEPLRQILAHRRLLEPTPNSHLR